MTCSHVFRDTSYCLKCGVTLEAINAAGYDEAMRLLAEARTAYEHVKACMHNFEADLLEARAALAECEEDRSGWKQCSRDWRSRAESAEPALLAERAAHEQTRRAWATLLLGPRGSNMRLAEWMFWVEGAPPEVSELVREHVRCHVGKCDRCGSTAPLEQIGVRFPGLPVGDTTAAPEQVCAWGCSPKAMTGG